MYVCVCHAVTDEKIKQLAKSRGCKSVKDIQKCSGLGKSCGTCILQASELIEDPSRKNRNQKKSESKSI